MFSGSVGHCVKSHQTNSDTTLSLNKDMVIILLGTVVDLFPKRRNLVTTRVRSEVIVPYLTPVHI